MIVVPFYISSEYLGLFSGECIEKCSVSDAHEQLAASTYRSSTKYWISVCELMGLVAAFFGAVGTGSMFSVVQYLVWLRYCTQ